MKTSRILCVDDEPKVLEGLQRLMHRKCVLLTATGAEEALHMLAGPEPIDVIMSDMRMPRMNGAALLAECRKRSPDTVRLLLTGQADLESAISAVNDGHIFRFLTKPCSPPVLQEALAAAVEQHRLITSERVLLERTLVGSMRALTEVLALVQPELGASARQHARARKVASCLNVPHAWHVEVASMLSQVGYVVLPQDLLGKIHKGSELDATERAMLARVPAVVERVIALIPRLEIVQEALKYCDRPFESNDGGPQQQALPIGSRILKALTDLGIEETRTPDAAHALAILRSHRGRYDPAVLDAIAIVCGARPPETKELTLRELEVGMVLASDVTTRSAMLLVSRGHPVTAQLLERLRNFDLKLGVVQPILCELAPDDPPSSEPAVELPARRDQNPMKNAKILCVDDEPSVLEGLQRSLYKKCIVLTAGSGEEALKTLTISEHIDVIVTDMRMPEMNGVELLRESRKRWPDTVRLLLTGQADLDSAISAVNEGQVFRFLTKPCPPLQLIAAIGAAVEKGRLASSERELLQRSLTGGVRTLSEVIALVHPGTLGANARQLERARKVSAYLHLEECSHLEIAVILAQAGYVVLPNDLLARVSDAADGPAESGMLSGVPLVLARVLSGIPHLESAQRALKHRDRPFSSSDGGLRDRNIPIGSRVLKALLDFGAEEARVHDAAAALLTLRSHPGEYDPAVLDAIGAVCTPRSAEPRSLRR